MHSKKKRGNTGESFLVVLKALIALKPQNIKLMDLRLVQGFGGELLS